jgi:ribosomal protein L37AE/L43A
MSKREDEYWTNEKSGLLYCAKHNRYYQADFGCQLCFLDKNKNERSGNSYNKDDIKESQPISRQYKYYKILEVSKDMPQSEIKRAFLRLAKLYHPDVNPNTEAHDKFKKINEAYEVLSNPLSRASYDNSPAECPICWTHEVIETIQDQWRCRHCGCSFNIFKTAEVVERINQIDVNKKLQSAMKLFQTAQCSWCKKFYTQPFLCPFRKLKSSCLSFDELDKQNRENYLNDDKWWWRMKDMIQQVQDNGILGKCRLCGALNPNPQEYVCWQCGENSLCCPRCQESPILRYNIQKNKWKCPNAGCGKEFAVNPKKQTLSKEICPVCKKNLFYDSALLFWICNDCKAYYTYQDLFGIHKKEVVPDYDRLKKIRNNYNNEVRGKYEKEKQTINRGKIGNFTSHGERRHENKYTVKKKVNTKLVAIKTCLILLAFICIAFIGWTVYLLYDGEMSQFEGIILLIVSISVLIWNISTIKKYRVGMGTLISLFLVILMVGCVCSAFAGIEPFSSIGNDMIQFFG